MSEKKRKRRGIKIINPDGSDGSDYGTGINWNRVIGIAISEIINGFKGKKNR